MTRSAFPFAPTTPIDSLDEVLLTSETWSDYQALQLIETQLNASLAGLTRDERERYLKLCRIEPKTRHKLAQTIQDFQKSFEELAYAELVKVLHQKTGQTLDLHHTYLHTRMLAVPERQWDKDPIELLTRLFSTRSKRAVADNAPREHLESMSLWQAAKENFAFNLSSTLHSGLDFQRASYIDNCASGCAAETIQNLSIADFVSIVREFDFATRLRHALAFHMASTINPQIFAHQKTCFELALLEARRRRTVASEDHLDSQELMQALVRENGLSWQFFSLQFGGAVLSQLGVLERLSLPFCILSLPKRNGVFSYFPERPEGALRHHASSADAIASLREQVRQDAKTNRIAWLTRTLSLKDQATLLNELKTTVVDQSQLNWLARQLYKAFGDQVAPAERIEVVKDPASPQPSGQSLLTAMEMRQSLTLAQDLQSIATSAAARDWERVKKTLLYIGSEILELLTLPAPGGVTGLNRLMMIASLGSMAYNTVSASVALARGRASEFIQAVGDIAELVITSRIQVVGTRLSARRTQQLIAAMGKPREVDLPNGSTGLWLADLQPYTQIDPTVLAGLSANPQGLFERNAKVYIQIQVDAQAKVAEVRYDADLKRYRLKHSDPRHYQPLVSYDKARQAWRLAPVDVGQLSNIELLQIMLRPDLAELSLQDIQYLQLLTQVQRPQLEAIWEGKAQVPWALSQATRDLQLRRGLDQLLQTLDDPGREWPASADQILPILLAQQIKGSLSLYGPDRRSRLNRHTASGIQGSADGQAIQLIQTGPGEYRGFLDPSTAPSTSLLQATLTEYERLNPGSTLSATGLDSPFAQRLAQFRKQTASALKEAQSALHARLLDQSDSSSDDLIWPLRQRFPALSKAAARDLLRQHPALQEITRDSALEPAVHDAIQTAKSQSRIVAALNVLADPVGRGLGPDAEAIFCNLLTVQAGWPAHLGIQVYQGRLNASGDLIKSGFLLETYGSESANTFVTLARLGERYAGHDQTNDDMLQVSSGESSLANVLLRTLTDPQREALGYQIHDRSRLSEHILNEALIHSTALPDLLAIPTSTPLSRSRLAELRVDLDFNSAQPDRQGLYAHDGKLYVAIGEDFFQVMRDNDASTPYRAVLRIVKPGSQGANDRDNVYVRSRFGDSEPITLDSEGNWVGYIIPGAGGGPKVDRLKEMRDKTESEQRQHTLAERRFEETVEQYNTHFSQAGSATYFLLAGDGYYELKKMANRNIATQVLQHRKVAATNFSDLPANIGQQRELLEKRIATLRNTDQSYSNTSDLYQTVSTLETKALDALPLPDNMDLPPLRQMQAAEANVISLIERFKILANDEIDRLLTKLEEFPAPAEPSPRRKPAKGKKKKPGRAPSKPTQPSVQEPKNRVEIITDEGNALTGKPRDDNSNVVDILDSRGQRKATYIRSSDGQYWTEHLTVQPSTPKGSSSSTPHWSTYRSHVQKLLDEVRHGESVADYLGKKRGATPSAPEGLLEYFANRLEETAQELQAMEPRLATSEERQQALATVAELKAKAVQVRTKGRTLRIDLILSNNTPTANDLQYLADTDHLALRKTQERISINQDYIDEFELKIKDRNQVWAYAHLHYPESDSDALAFTAAHLKRPEQRLQGAKLQIEEARQGRRYEIHRGQLYAPQVEKIFFPGES